MDPTAIHLGPRIVFFTDGSSYDDDLIIGAGVTYKEFNSTFTPWTDLSFSATGAKYSATAKHLAINRALSVVVKKSRRGRGAGGFPTFFIFTDSRYVIRLMYDFLEAKSKVCDRFGNPEYKSLARHLSTLVSRRVPVKIYWVKAHAETNGNNRADKLAGLAVRWALTQPGREDGYKVTLTPETLPEICPPALGQGISKVRKRKRQSTESAESEAQ